MSDADRHTKSTDQRSKTRATSSFEPVIGRPQARGAQPDAPVLTAMGPPERCALCELDLAAMTAGAATLCTVAYADGDVVVWIDPDLSGVLVAPRAHLPALDPAAGPAPLLAALRKAALHVEETYGTPRARIEPTADKRDAEGHVCYRVVPAFSDPSASPRPENPAVVARGLAGRFRDGPSEQALVAENDAADDDTAAPAPAPAPTRKSGPG